jgi:dTDP-4-amino-4,6-dideoxygalactose transaminase
MSRRPSLLGVNPIFEQKIPFVRPDLPLYSEIGAEVQHLLDEGELTKGRHLREFEQLRDPQINSFSCGFV